MQTHTLVELLKSKRAVVGVVGLGYVGLPLAVEASLAGFKVIGLDVSEKVVNHVNSGVSHIKDVDSRVLFQQVTQNRLSATSDFSEVSNMDAVLIAVPTPLDDHLCPDVSCIISTCESIRPYLRSNQLICLESTTYPGTTEKLVWPLLSACGLEVERDLFLAYSPERVDPGNQMWNTKNTPKVIGAWGQSSLHVAVTLYESIVNTVVPVSSLSIAEFSKLFENTFRAVNIALVNEMLLLCNRMNLDVWEVIRAANTKPFGIMKFVPSAGVGGHCIPEDPHYLEWAARAYNFRTRLIDIAGDINRSMPDFVCSKAAFLLNNIAKPISQSRILILGVAYKKGSSDVRESPSLSILRCLHNLGGMVQYHDPYVPSCSIDGIVWRSVELTKDLASSADLVIVVTPHSLSFSYQWLVNVASMILDTCEATFDCLDPNGRVTKL